LSDLVLLLHVADELLKKCSNHVNLIRYTIKDRHQYTFWRKNKIRHTFCRQEQIKKNLRVMNAHDYSKKYYEFLRIIVCRMTVCPQPIAAIAPVCACLNYECFLLHRRTSARSSRLVTACGSTRFSINTTINRKSLSVKNNITCILWLRYRLVGY
jgi:hypothetical protein